MTEIQFASVPDRAASVPGACQAHRREARSEPNGLVKPPARSTWLEDRVQISRRRARPTNCPRCHQPILIGPDHDTASLTARIDTTPVDPITEVAALLAGRASYDLIRGAISYRDREHHHSPNRPHPVHLEHTCPRPETAPCLF